MKLELKHLAPYLPYNIEFFDYGKPQTIIGWKADRIYIEDCHKSGYCNTDEITTLLLCPLSECVDINSPFLNSINADLPIQMQICDLANKRIGYWNCSYQAINTMCEHHIDIFGLIDAGLAIEKK